MYEIVPIGNNNSIDIITNHVILFNNNNKKKTLFLCASKQAAGLHFDAQTIHAKKEGGKKKTEQNMEEDQGHTYINTPRQRGYVNSITSVRNQ